MLLPSNSCIASTIASIRWTREVQTCRRARYLSAKLALHALMMSRQSVSRKVSGVTSECTSAVCASMSPQDIAGTELRRTPSKSSSHSRSCRRASVEVQDAPEQRLRHGMVLPFQPLTMTFVNVSYFVDVPSVSCSVLNSPPSSKQLHKNSSIRTPPNCDRRP